MMTQRYEPDAMPNNIRSDSLLRNALRGNVAFCASSGLLLAIAAMPIAEFMGIENTDILGIISGQPFLRITGVLLIIYAGLLAWLLQIRGSHETGLLATSGDMLWVGGSLILLVSDALNLTNGGNWAVLIVGDMVLLFAVAQIIGLRRMSIKQ